MVDIDDLRHKCAVWQLRMGLRDWSVEIIVERKENMPDSKSGLCKFLVAKKSAKIYLLHPADADPEWINPYDIELTLVHELTHLHLAPWNQYFAEGDQEAELFLEQAVHALSTSLYEGWKSAGTTTHVHISAMDAKSFLENYESICATLKNL